MPPSTPERPPSRPRPRASAPRPGHWLTDGLFSFGKRVVAGPRLGLLELRLHLRYRLLGLGFWLPAALSLALSAQAACSGDLCGPGDGLLWVALAAAAPVLFAAGAWLLFDLGRVRLDRASGRVTAGFLPGLSHSRRLQTAQYLHLSSHEHPRDEPAGCFRATLVFTEGDPDRLLLTEEMDLSAVQGKAALVAEFIRVPVRAFLLCGEL